VAHMDTDLALIDRWLRGESARASGPGATDTVVGPHPVQVPRPPIWLGGMRPGALRRAARWDGWIAIAAAEDGSMALTPEAFGEMLGSVRAERDVAGRAGDPFDVAVFGISERGRPDAVAAYAAAGATWWLETLSPMRGSTESLLAFVEAGPPRAE
jgi:luciferase-like monooxygenase